VSGYPRLLTPAETAARFGVHTRTLRAWEGAGKITAQRTLGGHRRYREDEIEKLLEKKED
jgi:excisionase family DNA binding protein